MRQKLLFTVFIILLLVTTFYTDGYGYNQETFKELNEMSQVMENNDISVDKWSVYAREDWGKLSVAELEDKFQALKKKDDSFSWVVENNSEGWNAVGERYNKETSIKEEILLFGYPHDDKIGAYIVYKATGTTWDLSVEKTFSSQFNHVVGTYFFEKPQKFSCITGESSDMMEVVLNKKVNRLIKEFSAEEVESLKEGTFVSVSAYTSKWKNEIPTQNGAMNLQIAIRQGLGGVSTVTIGTPIITSEY
jgi:hypothetical protein